MGVLGIFVYHTQLSFSRTFRRYKFTWPWGYKIRYSERNALWLLKEHVLCIHLETKLEKKYYIHFEYSHSALNILVFKALLLVEQ